MNHARERMSKAGSLGRWEQALGLKKVTVGPCMLGWFGPELAGLPGPSLRGATLGLQKWAEERA